MRLLAKRIGENPEQLALGIADKSDDGILSDLAAQLGRDLRDLSETYFACWVEARTELVREIGDPTPHRLGQPAHPSNRHLRDERGRSKASGGPS